MASDVVVIPPLVVIPLLVVITPNKMQGTKFSDLSEPLADKTAPLFCPEKCQNYKNKTSYDFKNQFHLEELLIQSDLIG